MNKIKFISLLQINYTYIQTNVKVWLCHASWLQTFISTVLKLFRIFFPLRRCGPTLVIASPFTRFLDHTQRRTEVGRTPLDEWSARCKDLYLTTHKHPCSPVGFETTVSAGEWPQTSSLDRAATGICNICQIFSKIILTSATATNMLKSQILALILKLPWLSRFYATPSTVEYQHRHTSLTQQHNTLKTNRRPLYLKTESVPRCKHVSSRL